MYSDPRQQLDVLDPTRRVPGKSTVSDVVGHIRLVADGASRDALLASLLEARRPLVVSFFNAHAFNLAWTDEAFANSLHRSDVLLRDGVGASVLLRLLGIEPGLNMNGTDFIPLIAKAFAGKKVALCGTRAPYLTEAAAVVESLGGHVVLAIDGFAEAADYLRQLAPLSPDLIILGMGMPKQELVAMLLARNLACPAVIVNGGAILDFWAGRVRRAPLAVRRLRLEWLFRLIQEPRRLWRRYITGGVLFSFRILQLRLARG